MLLGTVASASAYVIAGVLLHDGPTVPGYDVLMVATDLAITTAAFAAMVQVLLALADAPANRARATAAGLLAATTAVPVVALVSLGAMLSTLEPLAQPTAVNSLVLAMWGVGKQLVPVPVGFAAAAVLIAAAPILRSLLPRLPSSTTEALVSA